MKEKFYTMFFVQMDEAFVAELGEALDQYNFEDYPHLVMDVWEDPEHGTLWEIGLDDEPFAYDVPEEDITRFHRFADCQHYYNPRDEILCYFVLCMRDYATRKGTEK